MIKHNPIPVIMYHSVGRNIPNWKWSFLTIPHTVFEDHLKRLAHAGYRSANLSELNDHVTGRFILPPKSFVLTFDDGYLDNWTYAAPLLERYGFSATVFVNPEFVDPKNIARHTLHDVWSGRLTEEDLQVSGFMSWKELRNLSKSGVMSVQSHAMSHTWYPKSGEVIDFHHPDDHCYWLDWNACPNTKPYYLYNLGKTRVPLGTPILTHAKSLENRRFFPSTHILDHLVSYVASKGGESFFKNATWRTTLFKILGSLTEDGKIPGNMESDEDMLKRMQYELCESQKIIQANIGSKVEYLCWPGGAYSSHALSLALASYKAVTISSRDTFPCLNRTGDTPGRIRRLAVPSIEIQGKTFYPGGQYLKLVLDEYQHISLSRKKRQLMKLIYLIKYRCSTPR